MQGNNRINTQIAIITVGLSLAGAGTATLTGLLKAPPIPATAEDLNQFFSVRGDLKFEKFHQVDMAKATSSITYKGKVVDLRRCGTYEFSLKTSDGTLTVFVPSSFTTMESPSGLSLSEPYQAGAAKIPWDSIVNGAYNTDASVHGQYVQTNLGKGIVVKEMFVFKRAAPRQY